VSKIFDAYRKKVGDTPDLAIELGKAGSVSLYPVPEGSQRNDFNKLANKLLGLRPENRGAVLAFGSSAAGEGASFVSYNAAVYLATVYHQKVAWIDANFLSPQKKLMGQERKSFSNILRDPSRVDDLVVTENPLLIPVGSELVTARGLLADQNYGELLRAFSRRFDFVIIDLPPVLVSDDTALLAASADGFLLVIEQKYLKREVIDHGLKGMKDKGVRLLGSVINRRTYELPKMIYDRL